MLDNEAPRLTITPGLVGVTAAKGADSATVKFPDIVAEDSAEGEILITCLGAFKPLGNLTYAPGMTATFALGTTPVTCTARDVAGNPSEPAGLLVTVCASGFDFKAGNCTGGLVWGVGCGQQ
jgi:hypothetical protein